MAAVPDVVVKVRIEGDQLKDEQLARGEALLVARRALVQSSVLGTTPPVEAYDLIQLAEFILDGPAMQTVECQEVRTLSGEVIDSSWAAGIPTPVDPAPGERSPF